MAELRSQISDEFAEKLERVMEESGIYNKKSDYIREAVRNQMREDLEFIKNMEELDED